MENRFRKLKLSELKRSDTKTYAGIEKLPVIVVLDNVRSLHNIGSVFRTADAFLVSSIWLCGITATPPHREIHKTALGAEDTVRWDYFNSAAEVAGRLQRDGVRALIVEQSTNSTPLQDIQIDAGDKVAVVFGNEVEGVSEALMAAASRVVEIPQMGTKHSLNVSVAAGIVLWEIFRKFRT